MAVTSQGGLTPNLAGLEKAWTQASRITEQKLRQMQRQIEDAARKIGLTLSSSATSITESSVATYVDVQERAKKQTSYSNEFDILRNKGALAAAQVGMGTRESDRAMALSGIDQTYAQGRAALEMARPVYSDGSVGDIDTQKLEELKANHQQMTLQVQSNYVAMTEAQGNWINGATAAWDDYLNDSGNVASKSKEVFSKAFNTMGDAVTAFALTGKFSFSDFTKSVLTDMAKLAAQTAMSSGLSSLFGMVGSAAMSWLGGAAAPAVSSMQLDGNVTRFVPQLGVQELGSYIAPSRFANGGVFTNSIATGPSLAPMALFGEAGPEAIMPLSRGSDGSLGVVALSTGSGSTSSNQVVIQQTINVEGGQGGNVAGDVNSQTIANAYAGAAKQGAAEQIARDLKPGGQIWSAINGR